MILLEAVAPEATGGPRLLEAIDLHVDRGGGLLLTGASGSGKTWLLRVLAGTERPAQGRVSVGGRLLWPGAGALGLVGHVKVGLAFAQGGLLSNLTLRQNLRLPLSYLGLPAAEVEARTKAALSRLGLQPVADLRPHAVSGAARRHGNLARVLALEPELVLLDDPLEGLDAADRATALDVIRAWVDHPDQTVVIAQEEPGLLADWPLDRLELRALTAPVEGP